MEEVREEEIEMKWSALEARFFSEALKPGQSINVEMTKEDNGSHMKIQTECNLPFFSYAIAMLLYKNPYRKKAVKMLTAAMRQSYSTRTRNFLRGIRSNCLHMTLKLLPRRSERRLPHLIRR